MLSEMLFRCCQCHHNQGQPSPSQQNGYYSCQDSRNNICGCIKNCRNRHRTEYSIGNIIQEILQKLRLGLFSENRHRQHPNEVGYHCHDQNRTCNSHLCPSCSVGFLGKSHAHKAAVRTPHRIIAKPLERNGRPYLQRILQPGSHQHGKYDTLVFFAWWNKNGKEHAI